MLGSPCQMLSRSKVIFSAAPLSNLLKEGFYQSIYHQSSGYTHIVIHGWQAILPVESWGLSGSFPSFHEYDAGPKERPRGLWSQLLQQEDDTSCELLLQCPGSLPSVSVT